MDQRRRRQGMMLNLLIVRIQVHQALLIWQALRAPPQQPAAPPAALAAAQPADPQAAPRRRRARRRPNIPRDRLSPFGLTPQQTLTTYRFDMDTILSILEEIHDVIAPTADVCNAVPPLLKLMSVLHFCATGTFQNTTGALHGLAQPTFSLILTQVLSAMMARVNNHISMPHTAAEFNRAKAGMYALAHFPHVVGCIDCTHIAIVPPSAQEHAYRNRKMTHSMNVQMVCDADLCIMQVCARFPGSAHDSRILRQSSLFEFMEQRTPARTVLLGDSGYPLLPWLMTPFRNPQTPAEENFNRAHIRTRNTIERTFGVLKSRFRCLDRSGGALLYKPEKVGEIVIMCAILHNIAVRRRVPLPEPLVLDGTDDIIVLAQRPVAADVVEGRAARNEITVNYFT